MQVFTHQFMIFKVMLPTVAVVSLHFHTAGQRTMLKKQDIINLKILVEHYYYFIYFSILGKHTAIQLQYIIFVLQFLDHVTRLFLSKKPLKVTWLAMERAILCSEFHFVIESETKTSVEELSLPTPLSELARVEVEIAVIRNVKIKH